MNHHCGILNPAGEENPPLTKSRDVAIFLLTPGFSRAFFGQALGVSPTTIAKYLDWSHQLALKDPAVLDEAHENATSITAEDGLYLAQKRGNAHLPWWSKLAIAEYRYRLGNTADVAAMFGCSPRTVQLALKRLPLAYEPFSGRRQLSRTQANPPGMWRTS